MTEPAKKQYNSEDFQESHFGIRNKADLVHIFNVLRNKMYTNKPLAVLREYSTNAMDAHIESDQKTRPIEVSLPTATNRTLSIRDYGKGLSEEDIRGVYTMYGASTKRGSTELNGQLGFGSKAAFSYTDNYTIVSYHEGRERTYEAYVDETGLGAISLLSDKETDKPSGIEIRIQVQLHDIPSFQGTAAQLYKYFAVTPKVSNLGGYKIVPPSYSFTGTNWGFRKDGVAYGQPEITAIMGNVGYPLSYSVLSNSLRNYPNWSKIEPVLRCPMDLKFPVGALSIAASREALEYDKKTLKAISDALENAVNEITKEFNDKLAKADNLVEAKKLYKTLIHGELAPLAVALGATSRGLRWKDKNINNYYFNLPSITHTIENEAGEEVTEPSYTVMHVTTTKNSYTGVRQYWCGAGQQVEVGDNHKWFVRDTKEKPMLRIRQYFNDHPDVKNVYVFEPTEQCTLEDFCEEFEVPAKYLESLAALTPMQVEKKAKTGEVNVKHQQKVFKLSTGSPSHRYADSSHWESTTIESDKEYYYVYLDRFVPCWRNKNAKEGQSPVGGAIANHSLRDMLDKYKQMTGKDIKDKIIGIKISAASRVKENWKPLNDVFEEAVKAATETIRPTMVTEGVRQAITSNQIMNLLYTRQHIMNGILKDDSPLKKLIVKATGTIGTTNSASTNTSVPYQNFTSMRHYLGLGTANELEQAKNTEYNKTNTEINQLYNRYPLFRHINVPYWNSGGQHEALTRDLLNYCAAIDKDSPKT